MNKIDEIINRLNFGVFFPISIIDLHVKKFTDKIIYEIVNKTQTPQKTERIRKEKEKYKDFVKDIILFCNYNLIDCIVGFSIAAQFLVITAETPFSKQLDNMLYSCHINLPAFLFLLIASGIISYLPLYYFFHRNDKRVKYFEAFGKEPTSKKWIWSCISIIVYTASWAITISLRSALK